MASTQSSEIKQPVISSQDVEGVAVYDGQGKKLGTVDHLVIERLSGRVLDVVISGAGFLGLGHAHSHLPWSALRYNPRLAGYETEAIPQPA